MLLKKLKSNHTINLLLFPVTGVALWLKNLVAPHQYPSYEGAIENLLFVPLHNWIKADLLLQNIIALVLFLMLAAAILQISNQYNILKIRTMLPATLFVLVAGGFTRLHFLHPVYFGAIFLLVSIYRLFSAYDKPQPYSAAFDSGFFLGLSILFYLNIIILLPAFLVGIGILSRETRWREYIILFTGFILPSVFALTFAWLTGIIKSSVEIIWLIYLQPNTISTPGIHEYTYTVFLLFLTLLGSLKIIHQYDSMKVSMRKFFIVFFLIFTSSMLGIFLLPSINQEMLLIATIPVTFLFTNYFVSIKSRFWGEFWFLLLILIVAAMQILK
jgi:hypothetical protein